MGVDIDVVFSDKNMIVALVYSDPPDLGFIGTSFTWSNKREGLANIRERLDQCLCDQGWQTLFPKAGVRHLSMWTKEKESKMVVENAWQTRVEGSHGFRLAKKLSVTSTDLVRWNKNSFGNTEEKIKDLQDKLLKIQQVVRTKGNLNLEASLNLELDEWLAKEDLWLRQNSIELWVKEGDCNSRFFHLSTIIRRRRNYISEIKVPSRDEIKKVVFGMKALKASGPDGFPVLFYKNYWDIVGDQLMFAVQGFFRNGWLLKEFNKTFISLIPKKKGVHNFNYFRSIGLCNVCYKVI
uniref:Reverse transcriptase n=1 Tax=Quercus lobata TaxID=97700 RepID=A0A7N2LQ01_QUELO